VVLERGSHLIKSVLRVLDQRVLAGTEADFSLRDRLVLVDLADGVFRGGDAACTYCAVC
jgi:hypothetical protein